VEQALATAEDLAPTSWATKGQPGLPCPEKYRTIVRKAKACAGPLCPIGFVEGA
jgi:hypothetical protein